MSTEATSGQLLNLVLIAKDHVHAEHRRVNEAFFELYERTGRLVAMHLQDPAKARAEILELCDVLYGLVGDCDVFGDIADLLDPDGEFFRQHTGAPAAATDSGFIVDAAPEPAQHTVRFIVDEVEGELGVDQVLELVARDTHPERVHELAIGEPVLFQAADRPVSVTRVS